MLCATATACIRVGVIVHRMWTHVLHLSGKTRANEDGAENTRAQRTRNDALT